MISQVIILCTQTSDNSYTTPVLDQEILLPIGLNSMIRQQAMTIMMTSKIP